MDPAKLSREQQMEALLFLLFLKKKRMGDVKGQARINGAPQQAYIHKEEAASPTLSTELTFITASTATSEEQKVKCYDIPSKFVNTDMEEDVLMVLKGASEVQSKMIIMGHQISSCHVPVVRSFFIL